jgi:hypothetical protein
LESFIVRRLIVEPSFIVALVASIKPNYIKKIIDFELDQFSNLLKLPYQHQFVCWHQPEQ